MLSCLVSCLVLESPHLQYTENLGLLPLSGFFFPGHSHLRLNTIFESLICTGFITLKGYLAIFAKLNGIASSAYLVKQSKVY